MSGTQQNLTLEDAQAIADEVPAAMRVAPVVQGRGQLKYFDKNSATNVVGTAFTYFSIRNFPLEKGRVFTENEGERLGHVVVLGPTTAQNLMEDENPVGQTVKINGNNFLVIGVTKSKGDQGWFNQDDQALIPYSTAMKQLFGQEYLREIDVQGKPGTDLIKLQESITSVLRRRHRVEPGAPDDVEIRNQADILQAASDVSRTFTVLLGAVAGISLLVGGIGIMNIMLVTVTERTREIGVRKAIGAKDRDILRQFLFEAILMSGIGGLIGVAAGVGAAKIIGMITQFSTDVQIPSILMAMTFSALVGIFFGYYPASRAARLDPIEALRYE